MKFLFDLFLVILFFAVFKVGNSYDPANAIYYATAVAIVATLAQIAWVAVRHRRVDPMLWVSLGVVSVFGGATLVLHDETFIKWKPTALYWLFGAVLLAAQFGWRKNLIQAMLAKQISLPEAVWRQLNVAWALFFAALGLANLVVAYHFSTDAWVNFKLFGGTGCMVVFIIAQSLWLSRYLKQE